MIMEVKKSNKFKLFFKELGKYSVLTIVILASFFLGKFYENFQVSGDVEKVTRVERNDINIAIDENNNLIIIYRETGDYTIYQDSIGNSIFKLYAKSIWAQHTEQK